MNITIPDRYPGRCLNHRRVRNHHQRCLDYDGHNMACTFPEEPEWRKSMETQTQSWVLKQEKPKPWVSPLRGDKQLKKLT